MSLPILLVLSHVNPALMTDHTATRTSVVSQLFIQDLPLPAHLILLCTFLFIPDYSGASVMAPASVLGLLVVALGVIHSSLP